MNQELSDEARELLGPGVDQLEVFVRKLETQGEVRGLVGPREVERLWSRHVVNSAAVVGALADSRTVADLGSGGGFPGIVIAVLRPDAAIHLIEPMERRVAWLAEVVAELSLRNVTVHRARGEELAGSLVVDAVTSRAVAPIGKLARWSAPLLGPGGAMVALKGARAAVEVAEARTDLRKSGFRDVHIHEVPMPMSSEPARVVVARR